MLPTATSLQHMVTADYIWYVQNASVLNLCNLMIYCSTKIAGQDWLCSISYTFDPAKNQGYRNLIENI